MNKADLLKEALGIVEKRGLSYGKPENNFARISQLWSIYFGMREATTREGMYLVDETDVAILMVLMKVARLMERPDHLDSWLDIAGYAACGAEVSRAGEPPPSTIVPDPYGLDTKAPFTKDRASVDAAIDAMTRDLTEDPSMAKMVEDALVVGTATVLVTPSGVDIHPQVNVQRPAARAFEVGDTVVSKLPFEATWVGTIEKIIDDRGVIRWRSIGQPDGREWRTVPELSKLDIASIEGAGP